MAWGGEAKDAEALDAHRGLPAGRAERISLLQRPDQGQ